MVKWLSAFLFVFIIGNASFAQENSLVIEGSSPKLFIIHKVKAKENFYSIGRMYNVLPKNLASFNNLQFQGGLSVGQSVKIPLTEINFSQSGEAGSKEALIPVYHSIEPKEGLYRVSLKYNKVPLASIKQWNHLKSDDVSIGMPLIVGYLKVEKNESPLAANVGSHEENVAVVSKVEKVPEPEKSVVEKEKVPVVKNQEIAKQENKEVETPKAEEPKVTVTTVNTKSNINFSGGYFKSLYNDQVEKKSPIYTTGSVGVFKSTSGWQDGKYYCFNNDAPPGAIIKVTDNLTNKSVYAKVLDAIPDIKQNNGLVLILSNSAAEELGAVDNKFDCALTYVK